MSLGVRIFLAFMACLFGAIMFLHGTTADPDKAWFSYAFGAFCVSIAAASVLRGRAARFFGSVVGSCVFLAGLFYIGHEILAGPASSGSRSQPSVLNAIMFMVVFGVPAALYTFSARFGFGKHQPQQHPRAMRTLVASVSSDSPSGAAEGEQINPKPFGKRLGMDVELLERVASARKGGKTSYVVRSRPSESEIRAAAEALRLKLPDSYLHFCAALGVGDVNDELRFYEPRELYAFDMPGVAINGFIAIATDVLGNYLAFDPSEAPASGERPLYYCCHDPFGFGVVSQSFGDFIALLANRNFDYEGIVDNLPTFREIEAPRYESKKRSWWRFR